MVIDRSCDSPYPNDDKVFPSLTLFHFHNPLGHFQARPADRRAAYAAHKPHRTARKDLVAFLVRHFCLNRVNCDHTVGIFVNGKKQVFKRLLLISGKITDFNQKRHIVPDGLNRLKYCL